MYDKNRKRGVRIAQKSTYRHHAHDNRPYYRRTKRNCWSCEGRLNRECTECAHFFYHKRGAAILDNDLREYLNS